MTLRFTPIVLGREIILDVHDQNRVVILAVGVQTTPIDKAHDNATRLCHEYAEKMIPNTPFRFPAVLVTSDDNIQPVIDGYELYQHEGTEYFTTWIAIQPNVKPM